MPSIFVIKERVENPKEWYDKAMGNNEEWVYDSIQKLYHTGSVYLIERENETAFDDFAETEFFGWSTENWCKLAGEKELVYGYYNDDAMEAEYVHIKGGVCVREYSEYEGEVDTDEGDEPEFENWISVASYVDRELL